MIEIKAIGLHKARQPRGMRLMAFGTRIGMFRIRAPALDRLMDTAETPEGPVVRIGVLQVFMGMAAQAESGELLLVLAYAGRIILRIAEGVPVDVKIGHWRIIHGGF